MLGLGQGGVLFLILQGRADRERPHLMPGASHGGFAKVHPSARLSQQAQIPCQARHFCKVTQVFVPQVSVSQQLNTDLVASDIRALTVRLLLGSSYFWMVTALIFMTDSL